MIKTEDIMFWLPGLVGDAWTFRHVVQEVATAINWRRRQPWLFRSLREGARASRAVGDRDGARGFLFLALLLRSSLRAP